MARVTKRRPRLDPTEHPRPQVMVPMSIFGDILFANDYSLVGEFVHWWCHAVWKKDPTFIGPRNWSPETLQCAIHSGFVVEDRRSRTGYRLTGPTKDPGWLLDKKRSWSTYVIEAVGQNLIKIGKSTDVERRFDELQVASPHELRLLVVWRGDRESKLHKELKRFRVGGEWFTYNEYVRGVLLSSEAG